MAKVTIITDSTAYIPDKLVKQYEIQVAPQLLIWGETTLLDNVDITSSEFFARLKTAKVLPTTSQVTPKYFKELFESALERGDQVLAVLISNALSGTIASAVQAKELFPGAQIEIVDSQTTAMALGYPVLTVARAAQQGASLKELKSLAEEACKHVGVVFAVDTLEFLHRGGRIGGGSRFLGTVLNFKPILEVTGGKVEAVERVRTRSKSLNRVVDLICERIGDHKPVRLATLHANAPEDAKLLLDQAEERLNPTESILAEVSPVVANHAGPGTVGLAFMAGL